MVSDPRRSKIPLVAKLSRFGPLSRAEIEVLEGLCSNEEHFRAGVDLVNEGDPRRTAFILTGGLACRYRGLADGRRQILTFLLPTRCHAVVTLMPTRIAVIERNRVNTITAQHPRIGAALAG